MTANEYERLHADLGGAFSHYVVTHLDSPLLDPLNDGTAIIFQTEDPDFNAYELQFAQRARAKDDWPERPVTVVYVPVPHPPGVTDVDWSKAKVLARLVIKPEPAQVQATA